MPGQFFQDGAGHFEAALGGLIGIGGGSDGNLLPRLHPAQFLPQQVGGMLLDVDLLLEIHAVAHFHELVGVAGVAVFAGKLAAAIGIDGPLEGHAHAGAAVEQGTHGQSEVFDFVSLAEGFGLGRQARDADQFGFGSG